MATITSPRSSSPANPTITSPSLPSASNTPTSSVRHSIDLPTNPTTGQPTTKNPTNQRRNRAALRDYYNLKAKPAASAGASPAASIHNLSRTASIASTTSDSTHYSSATITTENGAQGNILPNTLDDPSFDAEAYIANLLKTSSLRDIIRTESSLVSEIRNLDGERKALVYDNYSKLIVAVGTIGEMQRGIVEDRNRDGTSSGLMRMKELEGRLDALMGDFKEVNGKGNGEPDIEVKRRMVHERKRARDERKKKELVQWVLDAPPRLREYVDNGKTEEAEKEWVEVQALLARWAGVKGVKEVKEECEKALKADHDTED